MARIDIDRFVTRLRSSVRGDFGEKQCARHVRLALENAGAITTGHPQHAKDWGPILLRLGFRKLDEVNVDSFIPLKGDVVVIQPNSKGISGHIQGYDGKQWISDFLQRGFWPGADYRSEKPHVDAYRM